MEQRRRGHPSKELERIERKSRLFMAGVIALVALGLALGLVLHR